MSGIKKTERINVKKDLNIPLTHSFVRCLIISIVLLFSIFVSSGISYAAAIPGYERLQPITNYVTAPSAVALVAESVNNQVLIFSQSGQYMHTLSGLDRPISVAVDSNVRIYVGNKDSGNVEVYDDNYAYLLKLGAGDGEFAQPNDIEIDSVGKIYVVDRGEHKVKIYNSDGTYDTSFGIEGSGDGEFYHPTSISINQSAEELVVLDHQLTQDMFGDDIEGARIQFFDMNRGFKRSFSAFGNEIGQMFRPQQVTSDDQGRLYVTDSFHNVVLVYDGDGTYLGSIYDIDNPLRIPLGVTMGDSYRLFIASLESGEVEIYGVDEFTDMTVTPSILNFQGQENGSNPAVQSVTIGNNGTAALNWSASTNDSWITLSDSSGSVSPSGTTAIDIEVSLNGLAEGTYNGTVSISDASGATERVGVMLEVLPPAELSVTPASLIFTSTNGSSPSAQDLTVINSGGGTLNWTAAKDSNWMSIDKVSGTAPDSIAVSVDTASLAVGTYTGSVRVTGAGALSSPADIPVTLNIVEITGTINGPESFGGSGVNWTETGVFTGTYTIVYGDVEGYTTPLSKSQTLEADGTINFHGEYELERREPKAVSRNIIVGAGPGESNEGVVKVYNADGTEAGLEFTAHGYGYGANIAAGDINNDGVDEIITAPGPGADSPAEVKIFDKNGNELTNLSITAFQYKYGANVAAGDFDGDGDDEVVAGAGAGAMNPGAVKVYVYDAVNNEMVDSGINLTAYSLGYGVKVAAGDIDCDDVDEIITVPGPGPSNQGIVNVWSVDTSSGEGQWGVTKEQEYTVSSRHRYSVNIASGDVDGDGNAEVVIGAGPDRRARDNIRIYDENGDNALEFRSYIEKRYGANVAGGDLDNDGTAEIVVGAGSGARNSAIVKVFDANGIEQARFRALNTRYGVNVAVGNLGY
jgi:hypothetical protein